jgi:two-component system, chemotaxis family, protein-glutamate methylesterase/glutaminase
MIRVLIVDADERRCEALAHGLEMAGGIEVVGTAGDGRTACSATLAVNPDVVLIAANLPVLSGEDATAWLSTECPSVRVVGLGAAAGDGDAGGDALVGAGAVSVVAADAPVVTVASAILGAVAAA